MEHRLMPWYYGYFLINPFRKYWHNTNRLLGKYLSTGMNVVDYGCAMGYFSLTIARIVSPSGKVYCFDIQPQMLERLNKRASNSGLSSHIDARLVTGDKVVFRDLEESVDFELLFAVAHEVPVRAELFVELYRMMKPGGLLFFAEPVGHVSLDEFTESVRFAENAGFNQFEKLNIRNSNAVLLKK